jgi:hypothetical protein
MAITDCGGLETNIEGRVHAGKCNVTDSLRTP